MHRELLEMGGKKKRNPFPFSGSTREVGGVHHSPQDLTLLFMVEKLTLKMIAPNSFDVETTRMTGIEGMVSRGDKSELHGDELVVKPREKEPY